MSALYRPKQYVDDAPNIGQVGDIKNSILTEAQFQSIHGALWVLMDGRDVTNSTYHLVTSNTNIPDARGQYIRGKNNGRSDGKENPAGELSEGTQQGEDTKLNGISIATVGADAHAHAAGVGYCGGFGSFGSGTTGNLQGCHNGTRDATTANGAHGHTITLNGDNETRPNTVIVNYFIKID